MLRKHAQNAWANCSEIGDHSAQIVLTKHTIVTTNVGMGSWAKVFGDPVVASAIADRLCHHCHLIRITGRSYRTKDLAPQDRASPAAVADSGAPR